MRTPAYILVERKCTVHGTNLRMYIRLKKDRRYAYCICHHCDKEKRIIRDNEKTNTTIRRR